MTASPIDLLATFVRLQAGGAATATPWTSDYWRTTAFGDDDRVVGGKHAETPADVHEDECEMHPLGDELLILLSGVVDVVLEEAGGERVVALRGGQSCIVPRGVWHRLILRAPGDLLFVTPPEGTRLRPRASGPMPPAAAPRSGVSSR